MTERSANHGTFVIERTYPTATPARTFAAWADEKAKAIWMDDPEFQSDENQSAAELDFTVGGHERFGGLGPDGTSYSYDALYYDIVPDQRIIYCYEMYLGAERMSVSVATVEFAPERDGTRLTYTEHAVFLDGLDTPESRREGTELMLDGLGKYLAANDLS
jgi:uncharacterized protein YndB with AHSA1/START domain